MNAQNLIDRLLTKNGDDRLGCLGGEEVKSHAYFNGPITHQSRRSSGDDAKSASSWTWEALESKEVKPPLKRTNLLKTPALLALMKARKNQSGTTRMEDSFKCFDDFDRDEWETRKGEAREVEPIVFTASPDVTPTTERREMEMEMEVEVEVEVKVKLSPRLQVKLASRAMRKSRERREAREQRGKRRKEERAANKRAANKRAANKRAANKRAANKRAANKRAANKRVANKRAANKRVANKRAANKRAANKRAANKRAANKRAAETRCEQTTGWKTLLKTRCSNSAAQSYRLKARGSFADILSSPS